MEHSDTAEAWLFGLELCKLLREIEWRDDPFAKRKQSVVQELVTTMQKRLAALAPKEPWSVEVTRFYEGRR
jgi:hypothetical protein